MGTIVSKAANGLGGVLANVFSAPFKTILGASCEDVCAGPWDVVCFIEHLCVSDLVKLLMILGLCYITLMFLYLLFKLGIFQCIGRSICKMCWAGCETYWFSLQYVTCFLWHKLKNTKRVHRRRFRDIEKGITSTSESDYSDNCHHVVRKKREGRNFHLQSSRYASSHSRYRHHHHVTLKTGKISAHVKGGSQRLRNSRRLKINKVKNHRKDLGIMRRRRRGMR
ncbi:uncharacterized protein LOC110599605 isoform X2 [Manihot esculenta]|uniref:Uncharacterized protein n=2 Tax=Manihot esculenta TaxID=3983 RepID=A0A2C9UHM3_MANES|nr:uncharacterized protein LOC110599605 isoform X2 [Manihot esculenta]